MATGMLTTPSVDINNWYRSTLGREADKAGLDYWTKQLGSSADPTDTYSNFVTAAKQNGEKVGIGLINQPTQQTTQQASQPTQNQNSTPSQPITPTTWDVSKNQTVAGQLENLNDPNNPLMVQAKTAADQQANAKGLINSSLAISAAQDALYKNAMPIAQQDANVNASAGQFNANSANTIAMANSDAQSKMATARLNADTQLAIANLDQRSKADLADLDAKNRQLLQTNSSASSLYNNTMQNIANISSSTTMDAAAKQQATDNQLSLLRQSLSAMSATASANPQAISNLNLAQYFQQNAASTAATKPSPTSGLINSRNDQLAR